MLLTIALIGRQIMDEHYFFVSLQNMMQDTIATY
jgi:hypothetical protein